jgi:hypothetical protein
MIFIVCLFFEWIIMVYSATSPGIDFSFLDYKSNKSKYFIYLFFLLIYKITLYNIN